MAINPRIASSIARAAENLASDQDALDFSFVMVPHGQRPDWSVRVTAGKGNIASLIR